MDLIEYTLDDYKKKMKDDFSRVSRRDFDDISKMELIIELRKFNHNWEEFKEELIK